MKKIINAFYFLVLISNAFAMKRLINDGENDVIYRKDNHEIIAQIDGFDFSDCTIVVEEKSYGCAIAAILPLIRKNILNKLGNKSEYKFEIAGKRALIPIMLRIFHGNIDDSSIDLNQEDFLNLYEMATEFQCPCRELNKYIEKYFSYKNGFADASEKYILYLRLPQCMDITECKPIYEESRRHVKKSYKDVREIFRSMNNFLHLPYNAIVCILNNNELRTDSENSVFYCLMRWIRAQTDNTITDEKFKTLFSLIQWNDFDPFFFENIVAVVATDKNPVLNRYYVEEYTCRAQAKLSLHNRHRPRIDEKNNKVEIKALFKINRDHLNEGKSLFSDHNIFHGYEWHIFIKMKEDPNGKYIAAFLKCSLLTNKQEFELPVKSTFRIIGKNGVIRHYQPVIQNFIRSDQGYGGRIFSPEDMQKFNDQVESDLLVERRDGLYLTIIVGIETIPLPDVPANLPLKHVAPFVPRI